MCDARFDCEVPRFTRNDTRWEFGPLFRLKFVSSRELAMSSEVACQAVALREGLETSLDVSQISTDSSTPTRNDKRPRAPHRWLQVKSFRNRAVDFIDCLGLSVFELIAKPNDLSRLPTNGENAIAHAKQRKLLLNGIPV